jgi:hypothetical protein
LKVKYDNQFYVNSIYKTLPADPKVPVVMLNGGDSGYTHSAYNLSKLAVQYKPDIIFIGGDVAYDNNIPACSYTWDFFLHMIEGISNQVGYIVPLALALGNHDAGVNELPGINISLDSTAFFKYFPQQFDRNSNGSITDRVPPVNQRRSFLYFKWAQVTYMILDSGYLHSFDGLQKNFIS